MQMMQTCTSIVHDPAASEEARKEAREKLAVAQAGVPEPDSIFQASIFRKCLLSSNEEEVPMAVSPLLAYLTGSIWAKTICDGAAERLGRQKGCAEPCNLRNCMTSCR